jgi:predicted nucleic acid-binding protein
VIVVDTNVVAYFLINGRFTKDAEAVRSRDNDWRVPGLFVHEWLNVMAIHIQAGIFQRDQAVRLFRKGVSLVRLETAAPDPVNVLNLCIASRCTGYDCEFVALANDAAVPLVTADGPVLTAFPQTAISMQQFAAGV